MSQRQENPIRILHVVTNMSYGGLENLLMNYYRNIDRTKVQFDFLTHVNIHQDFEDEIQALGGRIYRLRRLNPFNLFYRQELNAFFREHMEYKIVHCHLDCMAAIPLKAAKGAGIPVRIAHSHNSDQTHDLKYILKLLYKKVIPKYATDLFACGEKAGNWMFGNKTYTIMRNAIDAAEFQFQSSRTKEIRSKLCLQQQYIVGHVGQFRIQKNHLFLVEVFCKVLEKNSECILLLVGKGPQMESVQERVKECGIEDKVRFLGARSDIAELMQVMDVFVLPSIYEGIPVTMVEAQAAGLPCVISDRVPKECCIMDNVESIALSENVDFWAERILSYQNTIRRNNYKDIVMAGFDIKVNAKWLEEFYYNAQKD